MNLGSDNKQPIEIFNTTTPAVNAGTGHSLVAGTNGDITELNSISAGYGIFVAHETGSKNLAIGLGGDVQGQIQSLHGGVASVRAQLDLVEGARAVAMDKVQSRVAKLEAPHQHSDLTISMAEVKNQLFSLGDRVQVNEIDIGHLYQMADSLEQGITRVGRDVYKAESRCIGRIEASARVMWAVIGTSVACNVALLIAEIARIVN